MDPLGKLKKQLQKSRHSNVLIRDANGILQEVRGKGVVGEQPILNPGEKFEYTSGTPLTTSTGFMEGRYEMKNDNGDKFDVQIPQFSLDNPFESIKLNNDSNSLILLTSFTFDKTL